MLYAPRPGVDNSASPPTSQSLYNEFGQIWKRVDPDGIATLSCYNAKAELEYQVVALMSTTLGFSDYDSFSNSIAAGTLQSGNDRITQTEHVVLPASGSLPDLAEMDTYVFDDGQTSGTLVSKTQVATSGLTNWSSIYRDLNTPVTRMSVTRPSTNRTEIAYAPDGTQTILQYQLGRLVSAVVSNSQLGVITSTSYGYDPQGRQNSTADARNGITTLSFNNADQVSSTTTPTPGPGQSPETGSTVYDLSLRAVQSVQSDGTVVTNLYAATGLLTNTAGSRTYPVAYAYDAQGRMKTMTTWTNYPSSGAATTTWNYNPYRGWLDSKRYADTYGPDYTYTAGGRLLTRTWARTNSVGQRLMATYTYGFSDSVANNEHGDLVSVTYTNDPQNTPGVTYAYDRRGRQTTNTVGTAKTIVVFDNANDPLSETNVSGTLSPLSVTNGYDQFLRRTQLTALNAGSPLVQDAYGYDTASRLQSATDNTTATPYSATYNYLVNSALIGQITFKSNAVTRMTTSKTYDFLNRLTQISSAPSVSSAVSFSYGYNSVNQRTRSQLADGSYWRFNYDSLGQVISGHKFFSDETPVAGQQFDYAFDTIGNRTQTRAGGDQNGANQRTNTYSANILNQYSQRTVAGYVDIMGVGFATNPVTVNSQTAYRKGEYFRQQLSVANSSTPVWQSVTNASPGQTSIIGNQFVQQTPELFKYDLDGNLISDGRWNYSWDAENRLLCITNNNASVGPQQGLRFEYDAKGRRVRKQVWGPGSGTPTNDVKFVYDGWNMLAILNTSGSMLESFLWGLDLSGSSQRAGGVGGLLETVYYGATTTNCFAAFDGNGNVMALLNAADGTVVGQYEYGPFAEVIRATGPMAKTNPFRFSTKYQDDETDLVYFGYRYYNASTGRWVNRDPKATDPNIYVSVRNSPLNVLDPLGDVSIDPGFCLCWISFSRPPVKPCGCTLHCECVTLIGGRITAYVDYNVFQCAAWMAFGGPVKIVPIF